jgi:hypothetical protein
MWGWRDWPTEVNTFRRASSSPQTGGAFYQSRRLHSIRWVKPNRYLPNLTNVWLECTAAELNDSGKTLFESETIFNAAGEPSTYAAHKVNAQARRQLRLFTNSHTLWRKIGETSVSLKRPVVSGSTLLVRRTSRGATLWASISMLLLPPP